MAVYVLLAAVLFVLIQLSTAHLDTIPACLVNTLLLLVVVGFIVKKDMPLKAIPFIGRFFR